jgi:putative phosphoesterase
MQIGVLSDTHSRYSAVEKALGVLQERNINTVIHCGDIEDADTVWLFQGFTTHFVFGNCDWDKTSLTQAIHGIGEKLHHPWGHVVLSGVKIAFVHGDDKRLLDDLEHSGAFDFLFYGHTHHAEEHQTGPTRVVNPGALYRARPKTFLILDLDSRTLEPIALDSLD